MPPQTSSAGSLDPEAVALAKAIRQVESGGNASARGKSGEYGAYQFTAPTWAKMSAEAGLNVPLEKSTLEQQNQVAYHAIKKFKDAGLNPGQIASAWNAGEGEKDAYTGKFSNGQPSVGVNKYGAHFDVPAYAKSVATAYHTLKQGGNVGIDPNNPSSTANQTPLQPQEAGNKDSILTSIFRGVTSPVATMLARPVQLGAELLGATPEQVNEASAKIPFYGDNGALNVPQNGQDVLKDVGRGAETIALGLPVGGIGKAALAGTVAGLGSGLEQTGELGTETAKQGLLGFGLGAAGGTVAKLLEKLPIRLAQDAFKNMTPEQVEKALAEKTIGTSANLLRQSQKAIAEYGTKIDDILEKTTATGAGDFAIRATTSQFPEYTGKTQKLLQKIKSLIPAGFDTGLSSSGWERSTIIKYIDKIADGTATLWEKNRVRSAIDSATKGGYAKLARSLNPSAGHDLAMTFAGALRNEVQQSEPKTIPIFEEFSKEMGIQKALAKIAGKKSGGLLRWSDIVPFMLGSSAGPVGGLGAVAVNRAAQSPSTEFAVAKGIKGFGKVLNPVLGRAGLVTLKK